MGANGKREALPKTLTRLGEAGAKNKWVVVMGVLIIALFVVARNTVTKLVLTELNEFELYAAKVVILMIFQPLILLAFWRGGLVDFGKIAATSTAAKAVLVAFSLVGVAIFLISVFIIKRHMLTKVVTLHTAFQIILAGLVGYFLFNEKLRATEYAGLGLIVGGMLLMYYR